MKQSKYIVKCIKKQVKHFKKQYMIQCMKHC